MATKRAALYVRVSTDKQTVENQVRELTAIAERRGDPAGAKRMLANEVVQLLRGHSGHDVRDERVEDLGREPTGAAHAFESFGTMQLDHAVAGFGAVVCSDGNILGHRT